MVVVLLNFNCSPGYGQHTLPRMGFPHPRLLKSNSKLDTQLYSPHNSSLTNTKEDAPQPRLSRLQMCLAFIFCLLRHGKYTTDVTFFFGGSRHLLDNADSSPDFDRQDDAIAIHLSLFNTQNKNGDKGDERRSLCDSAGTIKLNSYYYYIAAARTTGIATAADFSAYSLGTGGGTGIISMNLFQGGAAATPM
eukprot:jgi/Psemu1/33861/gm1.33861_g